MTSNGAPTLYMISSEPALVTLESPFTALWVEIPVTGVVTETFVNNASCSESDVILYKGISVTSDIPIMLFAASVKSGSTDGTFVIPSPGLGTEYITIAHDSTLAGVEAYLIVSTQDNNTVNITTPAGVIESHTLGRLETFYREGAGNSGTLIDSSAPIYVVSGHKCANIPDSSKLYCDYIDEVMPPVRTHGKVFIVGYMYPRTDFTIGIASSKTLTMVNIYDHLGDLTDTQYMERGDVVYLSFYSTYVMSIISNEPILVTQYGHGSKLVSGDPSMMLVPSITGYSDGSYQFNALSGFISHLGVVVPVGQISGLQLDETSLVPALSNNVTVPGIGAFTFVYVGVNAGFHNLSHVSTEVKYSAWAYGRTTNQEYATTLGMMT